jgi:hypothetical protein
VQETSGFFIIETHVLNTTGDFRSEVDVEELWDNLMGRLCVAVEQALRPEKDPDVFLKVKECLIGFIMTLEVRRTPADCRPYANEIKCLPRLRSSSNLLVLHILY